MTLKTTRRRTKNATFLAVVVFFKAMIFQNSSKRDQIGLLAIFVRKLEKTKIKKKRPRMAHFWKTRYKVDNLKSLYLKSSTWRSKVAAVSTFSCRRFRRFSRRHPPKRVCVGVGKMRPEESDVKENPSQSVSQSVKEAVLHDRLDRPYHCHILLLLKLMMPQQKLKNWFMWHKCVVKFRLLQCFLNTFFAVRSLKSPFCFKCIYRLYNT